MKVLKNILILFLGGILCNGQDDSGVLPNIMSEKLNISTPENAQIMRYIDFPESNFIGKVDISIPLYEIEFGEITIPIKLIYNTKGNRVSDIATNVGLGWNLEAGGKIVVKVNDKPDFLDHYYLDPASGHVWVRNFKGYNTPFEDYGEYISGHSIDGSGEGNEDKVPDFYYVNAPKFNDKFYLTKINKSDKLFKANFFNNINAKLYKSEIKYKMDYDFSEYFHNITGHYESGGTANIFYLIDEIKLVNDNGYIYKFGYNQKKHIEKYPVLLYGEVSSYQQDDSWLLTEIESPYTNNKVYFNYEKENDLRNTNLSVSKDVELGQYPIKEIYVGDEYRKPEKGQNSPYNIIYNNNLFNRHRLKTIKYDKGIIEFIYNENRKDSYDKALSEIIIKDINGNNVKTYEFKYSYFENHECSEKECKRLKLESIIDSTIGKYIFRYGGNGMSNEFPKRTSSKTDFLGYYNANSSNIVFSKKDLKPYNKNYYQGSKIYFYPNLSKDQILPFPLKNIKSYSIMEGIDRSPNAKSLIGLLTNIQYPTGGIMDIRYENDDFMYEGEKYILGSSRVSLMRYIDNREIKKEIHYKYTDDKGNSSGQINFFAPPAKLSDTEILSGLGFNTDAIIGYSKIIEEIKGKGFIEKTYTNFDEYSDRLMDIDLSNAGQEVKNFVKIFKFPQSYIQSFEDRRGKLKEIKIYDNNKKLIKSEKFNYTHKVFDSLKVNIPVTEYNKWNHREKRYIAENYLLRYFENLIQSKETNYFGNNKIKVIKDYDYNEENYLVNKKNYIGKNDVKETKIYYTKDLGNNKLIEKNIFNKPLKEEIKLNDKNIKIEEIRYNNQDNILPSSRIIYNLSNIVQSSESIVYTKYDDKGNLLEYEENGIKPVSIIWGYHQTLPIAKIEGATYIEVEKFTQDIIKASDRDKDDISERELLLLLDEFRKYPELSKYHITTYTHNPLIGITSITPSTGIREVYKYDENNRLKKVLDLEGNIIREYKYNYSKNKTYYNSEHRQNFKSETCSLDANAEIYTYIVPEGEYSSIISQEDAEQKALDDIANNGQKEANQKGKCTKQCSFKYIENSYYPYKSRIAPIIIEKDNKVGLNIPVIPGGDDLQGWGDEIIIGKIEGSCVSKAIEILVPMKGSHTKKDWRWIVRIKEDGILSLQIEDYYNIFDSYSRKLFHNKLGENKMLTVTIILNLD